MSQNLAGPPQENLLLGCDIGGAKEPGMMYFPTNWGAKEPQNFPNHRVDWLPSLKLTANAPENRPKPQRKGLSSNKQFSGASC